mgnify:CR=1 FL=1
MLDKGWRQTAQSRLDDQAWVECDRSIAFSGDALARIAVDPFFSNASGKYLQSTSGRLIEARSSVMSYDAERARKLWQDCEKIVDFVRIGSRDGHAGQPGQGSSASS